MAGRNDAEVLWVTCPYNVHHKLAPRSYATHLERCARQSNKVLAICKYNSLHRIEPALLEYHYEEECADRRFQIDIGWDKYPDAKPEDNEVNDLADALENAAINGWPEPPNSSTAPADLDDWESGPRNNYLAPDCVRTVDAKPTPSFTMNKILVQRMTKSEKKKFYAQQLAENESRIEKAKREREVKEKRAEMEKKFLQELEEKAAIEKEKQEREEKKKEIERKKKEKKEKIKEAKRAAYLAKQTEKPEQQSVEEGEKKEEKEEKVPDSTV